MHPKISYAFGLGFGEPNPTRARLLGHLEKKRIIGLAAIVEWVETAAARLACPTGMEPRKAAMKKRQVFGNRKHVWAGVTGLLAMLALVLAPQPDCAAEKTPSNSGSKKRDRGAGFFAQPAVHNFKIQLDDEALKSLRQDARKYVKGTVTVGDTVYKDVAIHLKGRAGSFRGMDDKPAFTLNFDKSPSGQKFHGLRKIHLNNSVQDPSYLNEYLAGELFRAAGVPAPRVSFALVELNGRKLGLHVLKEGFSKDYLSLYFDKTDGNLYDLEQPGQEITEHLQRDSGDGPDDWSDLKALADAAREPDVNKLWGRLEQVLDLDQFISFMAMEVMTCHWDGYCLSRNNCRIYHDNDTGKFVFFPHGMDQMFGDPNVPIAPGMNGLVAQAVMRTSEGRRRYRERFEFLFNNVYKVDVLTSRVSELAACIHPALASLNPNAAREFDGQANAVRDRIVQRARNLEKQIVSAPKPLKFENSIAKLGRWRTQSDQGNAKLEQTKVGDKPALHIQCEGGGGVASWRTSVLLGPGKYRFTGQAKVSGVVPQTSDIGGGGLRISGGQRKNKLIGDLDWTQLEHEFAVEGGEREVVLVCELRATKGEIWFDAESLQLEQMK